MIFDLIFLSLSAAFDTIGHTVLETHHIASMTPLSGFSISVATLSASPLCSLDQWFPNFNEKKLELLCIHILISFFWGGGFSI